MGCNDSNENLNEPILSEENQILSTNDDITLIRKDLLKFNTLYLSKNVSLSNNNLISLIDEKVWFIPYDNDIEPKVLIDNINNNSQKYREPEVSISCDCSTGTIGTCDTNSETEGETETITCEGSCVNLENENPGECKMKVVITNPGLKKIEMTLGAGIIVSSKSIKIDNKIYQ